MSVLFLFFSFLVLSFPMFYSPVSLIGILLLISLSFVLALSIFGSFWYSYILCLIYVGGLLVLFIYICLVSSNFPISIQMDNLLLVMATGLLVFSFSGSFSYALKVLGFSTNECGASLVESSNVSIFLFLVILLLAMLLVVVRVSGVGSAIVANEKA